MTHDDHRTTILPDVNPSVTRTLQVTPRPYFTPDNAILTAIYQDKRTGAPISYPVEVKRKDLLDALGAEPDETDYREVLKENHSLGQRLSQKVSEGQRIRSALGLTDTADIHLVLARIKELEKDDQEPEEAPYSPRDDQAQIDRSWALEKAGEVLGRLVAVGGVERLDTTIPIIELAWWILNGTEGDRG